MATSPKKSDNGQDLSMEEILQSIKKIIADEDTDGSPVESGDEEISPAGSDVLELTDIVEAPPASVDVLQEIDAAVAEAAPAPIEKPVEKKVEPAPEEVKMEPPPAAPAVEKPSPVSQDKDSDVLPSAPRLLSNDAAHASAAAFQKVIQTHKATTPMPHFRNGETIEELVLETLKPMLKEWLDTNLPPMVERIVEREISKLVD